MKGNHLFIICIAIFLLLMFAIECRLPKKFVWAHSFSHYDKQPLGCAVFDSLLSTSLPKGYSLSRKTFYELEQEDTISRRGILVATNNLSLTDVDVEAILKIAKRGNKIMLVSNSFNRNLEDTLDFNSSYSYFSPALLKKYAASSLEKDTLFWIGDSAAYPRQSFYFYPQLCSSYLMPDSLPAKVLAEKGIPSVPIALSYPWGKGEIILVSTPLLFTNYGVLDGKTGEWVSGMTKDSTRWIHQWREKGSQPGFGVKETSQFLIAKSTDDGQTWNPPVNITEQTKRKEWWLYAPAPGHGITLQDGTLVFPTQGRDKDGHPFSNITWSKDGGKTWSASNPAFTNVTECMAVQLSDGNIMLNMRDNRNRGNKEENGRRVCITSDLGKTWTEHPTSRKALIEPTCMGSIHKHTYHKDGQNKSILLFVNPESYSERNHITLKISYDDGKTWPENKKILLDEYNGRGYSCITSVNENTIGILYESSQADMVFQQIKLEELLP